MVITDRLKQIIFKQLYKELGNCEIIPYNSSMWFINRDNKYWYFELDKDGTLWWRYDFFNSFFQIFSMSSEDFCSVLSSWVEEVLNHKVSTTTDACFRTDAQVEGVLNHKVSTTSTSYNIGVCRVEDVLNHKVSTTSRSCLPFIAEVEEVLNSKACTTDVEMSVMNYVMEQVLNQ